ncbi:MAG: TRAM domain-containing protein, partial [Acidobacteria bacterium]|nr:TRAM domain-containing protein [Acidobacteriota bacterium]
VGFPGETEEDFGLTLSLLDEIEYDSIFSFKYSLRPNTPAAAYADAVPEEEKSRRLTIVQEHQRSIQVRRNAVFVGEEHEVLVEGRHEKLGQWVGRTSQNRVLNFSGPPADENLVGEMVAHSAAA